jgi:predicted MFS family arabinose efflux permease
MTERTSLDNRRMFVFLLVLTVASGLGMQGWNALFNNFAVEAAGFNGFQTGLAHSVREIPGFLSLLVIYVLLVISEWRLAALSILVLGAGGGLTGLFPSFWGVMLTTLCMSFGFHYYETVNQSLTLQYFSLSEAPVVMGRLRSVVALTNIAVGVLVWTSSRWLGFAQIFGIIGCLSLAAGSWALFQDPTDSNAPRQHRKMIFRRRYWVFYVLTFLAGARRQILLAFATFLLVKRFGFDVGQIAALFILNNTVNAVFNRIIGHCINRFGERSLLRLEYFVILVVFLTYAFCHTAWIVTVAYVVDQLLLGFAVCVNTYFQKIADPADIAPSAAVGFTINHIAAVVVPVLGGALWLWDYRLVFITGACLTVLSLAAIGFMRVPGKH